MEALQNFLEWLGGYVWGAPLLILLVGTLWGMPPLDGNVVPGS